MKVRGQLSVVCRLGSTSDNHPLWFCECICGATVLSAFRRSGRSSCARRGPCCRLAGRRFGTWKVVGPRQRRGDQRYFKCRCNCGKVVEFDQAFIAADKLHERRCGRCCRKGGRPRKPKPSIRHNGRWMSLDEVASEYGLSARIVSATLRECGPSPSVIAMSLGVRAVSRNGKIPTMGVLVFGKRLFATDFAAIAAKQPRLAEAMPPFSMTERVA